MNQITVFYDYVRPYCLLAKVPFDEAVLDRRFKEAREKE